MPGLRVRRDAAAVTSVLGVVLIIIISIALGAAIWVMINKIRETHPVNEHQIQVSFNLDQQTKQLRVVKLNPPNLDWFNDLSRAGTCTPTLNGGAYPTAAGTPIRAGDTLAGCTSGQTLVIKASAAHGGDLLFSTTY
jgi:hypothetical protein